MKGSAARGVTAADTVHNNNIESDSSNNMDTNSSKTSVNQNGSGDQKHDVIKDKPREQEDPIVLFKRLHKKAQALGLNDRQISELDSLRKIKRSKFSSVTKYAHISLAIVVAVVAALCTCFLLDGPLQRKVLLSAWFEIFDTDMEKEQCIVDTHEIMMDSFRPPVDCRVCKGITEVDHVKDITPKEFEERYAYSGRPVVIVDGAKNWTATEIFSWEFFRSIYSEDSPALENQEQNCQFFPYKTDFKNLREVFNMSEERANMKDGATPWYIGWSNCDASAANILRNHYQRPYFLPQAAESSKTDWIFMGSPGYGAHLHIDHVGNPSWQAQVTGTKRWSLEPPPECYHQCSQHLEVILHPGEIIVVDTNSWFHSTLNVGEDISICIGSEYD